MADPAGRRDGETRGEDLVALGRMLRELRIGQGFSLEDVERSIRVRVPFLKGIEEGRYEGMPDRVYVRGFVRTYCEFLHASDLWGRFERFLQDEETPIPPSGVLGSCTAPRKVFRRTSRLWVYLILLAALGAAGYLIWQQRAEVRSALDNAAISQPEVLSPTPPPPTPAPTVTPLSGAVSSGEPSIPTAPVSSGPAAGDGAAPQAPLDLSWMDRQSPDRTPAGASVPPVASTPVSGEAVPTGSLVLEARKVCWVKVSEKSGKVLFQGLLQQGESRTFQSSSVLRVRLGNGGATALRSGSQVLDPAGRPGIPVTLYLLPDGTLQKKRP